MLQTSHRIRAQEKKMVRRLLVSVTALTVVLVFAVFAGLPLLAKIILVTSSFKSDKTTNTTDSFFLPPDLSPLPEATNSAILIVSGYGEKGSDIIIYVNDKQETKTKADDTGAFRTDDVTLSEGDNVITATIKKDNKESSPSSALNVIFKKSAPKLDIESPTEDQKVNSDSSQFDIKGETDPGTKITVNDRFVIVSPNGKFTYTVSLSDGDNTFKIEATDAAGNKVTEERKVVYQH